MSRNRRRALERSRRYLLATLSGLLAGYEAESGREILYPRNEGWRLRGVISN